MNRSLGNSIGTRINVFDTLDIQTVGSFNSLFPECPIRDIDLTLQVIILGPASNNCRDLVVGEEVIKHKMFSDILYTVNKEDYYLDERDTELDEINGTPV